MKAEIPIFLIWIYLFLSQHNLLDKWPQSRTGEIKLSSVFFKNSLVQKIVILKDTNLNIMTGMHITKVFVLLLILDSGAEIFTFTVKILSKWPKIFVQAPPTMTQHLETNVQCLRHFCCLTLYHLVQKANDHSWIRFTIFVK